MNIVGYKKMTLTIAVAGALLALPLQDGRAWAAVNLFENKAEISKFKSGIKTDLFYYKGEVLSSDASEVQTPKAAVIEVAKATSEAVIVNKPSGVDENFKVEGIIKIGDRGCAIINSRIWYIGKPNMGYELVKLYDEMVEIKTPDGRTLKCQLIKEKKMEQY